MGHILWNWPAAPRTALRRWRHTDGQDLLEYGLQAALIAIFAAGAVRLVGNQIDAVMWQTIANNF